MCQHCYKLTTLNRSHIISPNRGIKVSPAIKQDKVIINSQIYYQRVTEVLKRNIMGDDNDCSLG